MSFFSRYSILRHPRGACPHPSSGERPPLLLVLVASAVSHSDRRRAIRLSWGREEEQRRAGARVVFLLGAGGLDDQDDQDDVLQEDFSDTYHNLTLKTVMGIKWASAACEGAEFVMKTDDDIFLNLPLLAKALHEEKDLFSEKISGCCGFRRISKLLPSVLRK